MTALIARPGHAFHDGTANGLSRLFGTLRDAWVRHGAIAALRQELQHLSDRELADIGISRHSIAEIARTAAQGK